MWLPFEPWRDNGLANYLVVGTVQSVESAQREAFPPTDVACESSEGVRTGETCTTPATDVGELRIHIEPSEIVELSADIPAAQPPVLGEPYTLNGVITVINSGEDGTSMLAPLVAAFNKPGMEIVAIVRVVDDVNLSTGRGLWGVVDDDGGLHIPMKPDWPTDMNLAPFTTLEELLTAARQ